MEKLMITLTAIIRARRGAEAKVYSSLLEVAAYVQKHEPETIGFYVSQDLNEPSSFTTFERFTDQAAMDHHNNGAGSKGFFAATENCLDGDVTVVIGKEISQK